MSTKVTQSACHVDRFCWHVLMRDQKWKNLKLQGQNLNFFFLQGPKPEFANITGTKRGINPKIFY